MNFLKVFSLLCFIYSVKANELFYEKEGSPSEHSFDAQCAFGSYPPPDSRKFPTYTVDLDAHPSTRWVKLTTDYKIQFGRLIDNLKNISKFFFNGRLVKLVDNYLPKIIDTLPYPFADELKGIANATGYPLGEVILYNIFYEIFSVCTSIIAQDAKGNIYHARNLDFGLLMGWDTHNHTWKATEILRTMVVNVDFQRNGKTLFRSIHFAGYVGVLTAMKPKAFSLTIDERFKLKGGYIGFLEWILGYRKGSWLGFLSRSVMENTTSYDDAKKILNETRLLSPVYFILAGSEAGQGSVITRGMTDSDIWNLGEGPTPWFLVQTNYDHWANPPFFDDRRTPTNQCMNKLSQQHLNFSGLFDVLSTKPALNKLTTYSVLMQPKTGEWESYLQYCQGKCSPW